VDGLGAGLQGGGDDLLATVAIPMRRAVLKTRRAISPRLATSTELIMPRS
jgi:hypothetical protein